MENKTSSSFQQAKEYSFLLLKFRLRSEKELIARLKKKRFNQEDIAKVIDFLKEKRFIDDAQFAKGWVDSRIKRPFGLRRIKEELRIKGVGDKIIDAQIQEVKRNYSEEEIVSGLAQERFSRLKNIDFQKARARVYGYLIRRGFGPDIVIDVLSKIFDTNRHELHTNIHE